MKKKFILIYFFINLFFIKNLFPEFETVIGEMAFFGLDTSSQAAGPAYESTTEEQDVVTEKIQASKIEPYEKASFGLETRKPKILKITKPCPEEEVEEKKRPKLLEKFLNTAITKKRNNVREIVVCTTLPLSGDEAVIGKEIFSGMNLVFNKINRTGGIKGAAIKLYSYDDASSFARASKNIKKLRKRSPIFISLFGLSTMDALRPYLDDGDALALFPLIGSPLIRDLDYKNIIYFRPSEKKEIKKLIDYSIKVQNKKAISVFYEKSEWGQAALDYAKSYLKEKYNLKLTSQGSYSKGTVNVFGAVNDISKDISSAIICIASARASYNFVRRAINQNLHHCLFLGLSRLIVARQTISRARGVDIVTASVVPDPEKSKKKIVDQYRRDMAKFFPTKKLGRFSLEGYINAQILAQVFRSIRSPITPGKIISFLEKLKKIRFRGLKLRFGCEPKTLSTKVWLTEDRMWVEEDEEEKI